MKSIPLRMTSTGGCHVVCVCVSVNLRNFSLVLSPSWLPHHDKSIVDATIAVSR